jgi:hypothetical protein
MGRMMSYGRYNFARKAPDGSYVRWRQTRVGLTSKAVCRKCNNGWMSVLEQNYAKPAMAEIIVSENSTTLSVNQLASIAAFTFKTAAIADYMRETAGRPFFSPTERRAFAFGNFTIPQNVWMWLASLREPRGQAGIYKSSYGVSPQGFFPGIELYVFTYASGHLVVQMVAGRWKNKAIRRRKLFPAIVQNKEMFDSIAVPFWPGNSSLIAWPPPQHLDSKALNAFCNRWQTVTLKPFLSQLTQPLPGVK